MSDTGLTPAEAAAAAMQRSVFGDDPETNTAAEPTPIAEPQREELSDFIEASGLLEYERLPQPADQTLGGAGVDPTNRCWVVFE